MRSYVSDSSGLSNDTKGKSQLGHPSGKVTGANATFHFWLSVVRRELLNNSGSYVISAFSPALAHLLGCRGRNSRGASSPGRPPGGLRVTYHSANLSHPT